MSRSSTVPVTVIVSPVVKLSPFSVAAQSPIRFFLYLALLCARCCCERRYTHNQYCRQYEGD